MEMVSPNEEEVVAHSRCSDREGELVQSGDREVEGMPAAAYATKTAVKVLG